MVKPTILALVFGAAVFSSLGLTEAQAVLRASDPACCAPPVCKEPCITYKTARCRKICCGCEAPQKIVVAVVDPACCKNVVDVPMCIPACCKGEPCVKGRCGLFGRSIVWYEWCCGFKARVVFDKCGDICVTYYGK